MTPAAEPAFLTAEDVVVRRTPVAVIVAIVLAAAVVVGLLGVGFTAVVVNVSHTEQGLCGSFGVPCTSLSLERVKALSGVALPGDAQVSEAYYNSTATSARFHAVVLLPTGIGAALSEYEPYGLATSATELRWAKSMHSLDYLGVADGDIVRNAVTGVDAKGEHEVFLSYATGS
jgi:hypothetical protein